MENQTENHLICSYCGYESNLAKAKFCKYCFKELNTLSDLISEKISVQSFPKHKFSLGKLKNLNYLKLLGGIGLLGFFLVIVTFIPKLFKNSQFELSQSVSSGLKINDIKVYDKIIDIPDVPEGTFSYGGSICFAALQREGLNGLISDAHPGFKLQYVEPRENPGCVGSIETLLNRELSFAHNARPLTTSEYSLARENGIKIESIRVAVDGIVFFTNKSLPLKSVSLQQLQAIYLGKISNWNQLDGVNLPNLPIIPISLDPKSNNDLKLLMDNENYRLAKKVRIVRDTTTAIRKVASTPGAISYSSSAILKGQSSINPLALTRNQNTVPISALLNDGSVNLQAFDRNNYPLTRELFVTIIRDSGIGEKAGIAYTNMLISRDGQELFKQAGFAPIYSKLK